MVSSASCANPQSIRAKFGEKSKVVQNNFRQVEKFHLSQFSSRFLLYAARRMRIEGGLEMNLFQVDDYFFATDRRQSERYEESARRRLSRKWKRNDESGN